MTRNVSLVLAFVAMLLGAQTAAAATPFTAGSGHDPQVAIAPDGRGHVAWSTSGAAGVGVGYCRVPAGGAACERVQGLTFPGAGPANGAPVPQVFADAGRVLVLASCWNCGGGGVTDRIFGWTSTDGGSTFAAAAELGRGLVLGGQSAVAGPLTFAIGGSRAMAMPGGAPVTTPITFTAAPIIATPALTVVPGAEQLLAASSDLDSVRFSVYAGPLTAAAVNTQASWVRDLAVTGATGGATETSLAAGPGGTYLAYRRGPAGDERARLHRWNAAARIFDAGREIQGGHPLDADVREPDLTQDPAGRLHVAWRSGLRGGRLRYRRSSDGGATFTAAANLALREPFGRPEIAAGADGRGFAVWSGASSAVRVVPLDPRPEPADPLPPVVLPLPPAPPAVEPPVPAGLEVTRLVLDRSTRRLHLSGRIHRAATGTVRVRLRAAGRSLTFAPAIERGRVRLRVRVPRRVARAGTGSVTLAYAGDTGTAAETLRLRAGRRGARLRPAAPAIADGRLRARGSLVRAARGRVGVRLRFLADGAFRSVAFGARIRNGRYRLDERLPAALRSRLARREGSVRVITTYAGRLRGRIHGEQRIRTAVVR
jgi:hypothetical protein